MLFNVVHQLKIQVVCERNYCLRFEIVEIRTTLKKYAVQKQTGHGIVAAL